MFFRIGVLSKKFPKELRNPRFTRPFCNQAPVPKKEFKTSVYLCAGVATYCATELTYTWFQHPFKVIYKKMHKDLDNAEEALKEVDKKLEKLEKRIIEYEAKLEEDNKLENDFSSARVFIVSYVWALVYIAIKICTVFYLCLMENIALQQ